MKCLISALLLIATPSLGQILPTDFEYQGAFVIDGTYVPEIPQWYAYGQRGLSYDADHDSLWVTGHDWEAWVIEIGVLAAVRSRNWDALRVAPVLTPKFRFATCPGSNFHLGAVERHESELWVGCKYYYNVSGDNFPTLFHRDAESLAELKGPIRVGRKNKSAHHSSRQGSYLFSIPQDWARQNLGGPLTLATGFARGAGAFGGSQGPTVIAFKPNRPRRAKALLHYRQISPECLEDQRSCDFPEYSACDSWEGATWVRDTKRHALLISGSKGQGISEYVPGGWDCSRNVGEILFYNPDDLAASAKRRVKPWEVVPYARWRPKVAWRKRHSFGGAAFDENTGRLFLIEKFAGPDGRSVVHVWILQPVDEPVID